jgi:type 2A phosphatase activator TIP41
MFFAGYMDFCSVVSILQNIISPFRDLLQRVMPASFFILLRYFLRIDNVMLRINDTRYYHEFDTDFILREYTSREAKTQDLNVCKKTPNLSKASSVFLPLR